MNVLFARLILPAASMVFAACHLDASEKIRCDTDSDCLDGYTCFQETCQSSDDLVSNEPLLAPTELSGTRDGAKYLLTWLDNASNESGYLIEGKSGAADPFSAWATVAADTTEHQVEFTETATFTFRVRAVRGPQADQARSSPSNEVSTVVAAPDQPRLTSSLEGEMLRLSWDPVDFASETEDCGYRVYNRSCGLPGSVGSEVRVLDCAATGVTLDMMWMIGDEYAVVAFNRWGDSPATAICVAYGE